MVAGGGAIGVAGRAGPPAADRGGVTGAIGVGAAALAGGTDRAGAAGD
jgi:hypothetical protein